MRILVVGINYAPDLVGVAKYNAELCEGLASFGHEVRVVTAPPYYPEWSIPRGYRGPFYRSETINGVPLTRSPIYVPGTPTGAKRLLHHASFALTSLGPVLLTTLRWRPDVIFSVAPSLMSAAFVAWISRRLGLSSWLHMQDFEVDAAFDLGLLSNRRLRDRMVKVERKILRSFDRVSTISPQMVDGLAMKGVDRGKIREIRNWTDTRQIAPGDRNIRFRQEQLGLNDSHFVALYSGTMSHKQGLELLVEAAKSLDTPDSNIRFVLCGDGPYKATLQSLAAGLNNVQFLGLQADESFAKLLGTADVHLVPQKAEAADLVFPSKLAGIFASGRPVIVMTRSGTGLAIEVGNAGMIVPPGESSGIVTAMRTLSGDPELCRALGQEARAIAVSRWDRIAILRRLEGFLLALGDKAADRGAATQPGTSVLQTVNPNSDSNNTK
jgi:colanic acid biosynthesis glycosyl transferase WcaI